MKSQRCCSLALAIITYANVLPTDSSARQQNNSAGPAKITGQVVDEHNNPIDGIEIKVFMGVERLAKDKTKNGGHYTLQFNPGGLVSAVVYTGLDYCPGSIFNVSGRTGHNITKVLYKRNPNTPCKNNEETRAALGYMQTLPKLFHDELEMYAGLLDGPPKGGSNFIQRQDLAQQSYKLNDRAMAELIRRVETNKERFRRSLDAVRDRSRHTGTPAEEDIDQLVHNFERATDQLRERFNRRQSVAADAERVLQYAAQINDFIARNRLSARANKDWLQLRDNVSAIANAYSIGWDWNAPLTPNETYTAGVTLTGTYRLNASLSEDPRREAQLITNTLPARDRRRIYDAVVARLEPPAEIAIERRGDNVTIASTRAPQINFIADGSERVETGSYGNTVRSRAGFNGDQLIVSTTGNRDSDFAVTFAPINNGRRLQVTRRITMLNVSQPIVVRSVYDRTADVARFDIYHGGSTYPMDTTGSGGGYVITNGTALSATLNNDINTRNSREGDRFTMTVREPSQYAGATIEGHISQVERSGRVTGRSGVVFNFDRIRLRDGRIYNFSGFVESVRAANGDTVRVDNEGTVQDSNRTDTTVQRTSIGAAVGAIIGAIAGGGKGAAIGAVLGAGGGAGSVYVQGSDDLDLRSGTEVTIRASSPNQ